MDIDRLIREYVRLDQQQIAKDIQFAPTVERNIRSALHQKRRGTVWKRSALGVTGAAAALLVLTVFPLESIRFSHPFAPNTPAVTQPDPKQLVIQNVLKKIYKVFPELQTYEVAETGPTSIRWRKGEQESVQIQFRPETGEIEYYSHSRPTRPTELPSADRAIQKATQFLEQMLGETSKQYQMTGIADSWGKEVTFQRYVNGLPIIGETAVVTVLQSGEVETYNGLGTVGSRLSSVPVPDPSAAIPLEQAVAALKQQMKLRYRVEAGTKPESASGQPAEAEARLDFTPILTDRLEETRSLASGWMIHAQTGEFFRVWDEPEESYKIKPPADYVKVRSKQDIADLIEALYGIKADAQKLQQGKSNREDIQSVVYSSEAGQQIEVAYDKASGIVMLVDAAQPPSSQRAKPGESKEDERKRALQVVEVFADPGVEEVGVTRASHPFSFYRKHDGIYAMSESNHAAYLVDMDPSTGQLKTFRRMSEPLKEQQIRYPSKQAVISVDEAVQEYLKHYQLKLAYQISSDRQANLKLELYYIPVPVNRQWEGYKPVHIDAVTGKAY